MASFVLQWIESLSRRLFNAHVKSVHDAQKQVPHFRFDRRGTTRVEPLFHEPHFQDPQRLRSAAKGSIDGYMEEDMNAHGRCT